MKFPPHEAALFLTHNEHLNYYRTVEQAIADGDHGYNEGDWITHEEMQKAIATNECWFIQWYPNTPVGFCIASASTLEALLAYVNE